MPVNSCRIRFYGDLKDLSIHDRKKSFEIIFQGSPGIKDIVEAEGIPHTEVGLLLVNGSPAVWKYRLKNGDHAAVFPFFKNLDIGSFNKVITPDYPAGRFVIDNHLGRLCKYLRILGFDAVFNPAWSDEEIISISNREKRIILTRDRGILKNGRTLFGCLIRSVNPEEQVRQVIDRFDLYNSFALMTRCLKCNGDIISVPAESVMSGIGENTKKFFRDFYRCSSCGQIYWKGSHYENMMKSIDRIFAK